MADGLAGGLTPRTCPDLPEPRDGDAGLCRLAAAQSRRLRPGQNRIGNAAARRDARALHRVRHSTAWLW
ncbi:hypothetical protein PH213_36045 [Streptomyces sp. SRF1]|uniref:hypothetical protein n=1 Tax=Streptomyces sp. SRF1 TaxID=1549642 RepID=UPI0025AF8AA7|nr:hypothetical protein [Streptomyces sp. SRF1]MDN3059843.1 hypothetical protein [Streptomyces sp. SRF1]